MIKNQVSKSLIISFPNHQVLLACPSSRHENHIWKGLKEGGQGRVFGQRLISFQFNPLCLKKKLDHSLVSAASELSLRKEGK